MRSALLVLLFVAAGCGNGSTAKARPADAGAPPTAYACVIAVGDGPEAAGTGHSTVSAEAACQAATEAACRSAGEPADCKVVETHRAVTTTRAGATRSEEGARAIACPDDAELLGDVPPLGSGVQCARAGKAHGPNQTYWPNGRLAESNVYVDGHRHGPWATWYPNGARQDEGTLVNDVLDGPFRRWRADGKPLEESSYVLGKRDGASTEWHDNGQVRVRGSWVEGRREGPFTDFWANGDKESVGRYAADRPCGDWACWSKAGEPDRCDGLEQECRATKTGARCPPCP